MHLYFDAFKKILHFTTTRCGKIGLIFAPRPAQTQDAAPNAGSMLGQHRRPWASIYPKLR